jgi:hypothetical protein
MRDKPSNAFVLEESARKNIEQKIGRMTEILDSGADIKSLPKSMRQFNIWRTTDDFPGVQLFANAKETVAKHDELLRAAQTLVDTVGERLQPVAKSKKEMSVARARERAKLNQKLRSIAEARLLVLMDEVAKLKNEVAGYKEQAQSMEDEFKSIQSEFEVALQLERARNAELVKASTTSVKGLKREK